MAGSPGEVTALLAELNGGDKTALPKLIPLVYGELRKLADLYLRGERPGHTLQPTALVHEAYLRLVQQDRADWQNRAQFVAVSARLMRRILVDYARARGAAKRAGDCLGAHPDAFAGGASAERTDEILIVDEALERLQGLDPQQARIVELRYFAGLTVDETAGMLQISARTVKRDWAMASAWLRVQLTGGARDT